MFNIDFENTPFIYEGDLSNKKDIEFLNISWYFVQKPPPELPIWTMLYGVMRVIIDDALDILIERWK